MPQKAYLWSSITFVGVAIIVDFLVRFSETMTPANIIINTEITLTLPFVTAFLAAAVVYLHIDKTERRKDDFS